MKDLEGRIIILADATTQLGGHLARKLIESRASVVLGTDYDNSQILALADELGSRASAFEYDNCLEDEARFLFEQTKREFGVPDTFIHELKVPKDPVQRDYLNQKRGYLYEHTLVPVELLFDASGRFMKENQVKGTNILITSQMDPVRMPWEEQIILPSALQIFYGIKSRYIDAGIGFVHYTKPFETEEMMADELRNLIITGKLS